MINKTGFELREEINAIRFAFQQKQLSYEEAKAQAAPVIAEMERRAAEIAKKYKKRAPKFSFVGLMR